jgi:catechol 2,3-dioxygenase-like lactoylglutathione lyase family enzyme
MLLQHIALTINDSKEIESFYEGVLKFSLKHKFFLREDIVMQIFHIKGNADVYAMSHQDIHLEIFLSPRREKKIFSHICLAYREAADIYNRALEAGYDGIIKSNPGHDTFFIRDKSGNMFEIKEITEQH